MLAPIINSKASNQKRFQLIETSQRA